MRNIIFNYIIELEKNNDISKIPSKLSSWIKSAKNIELYSFLMMDDKNFGNNFLQRLFNIRYNIVEYPKCKICGKQVSKFISYTKGYKNTCSTKCSNILKYGCEHPMQSKQVQENLKQSIKEKYGVDNAFKSELIKEKIKNKNLEKYGVENPQQNLNIRNKTKKTNLEKYGSENVLGSKFIREKIKKTNLEKYGTENILSSEIIREKIKKTNLEKYGVETPMENDKCKNNFKISMIKKYGVDNPLKIQNILDQVKETNLKKYGVEFPLQSEQIREKIKETNQKKYGNELYVKSREFLNISFNKFKNLIKDYVIPLFDENEFNGFLNKKNYHWKCVKCGNEFEQELYTSSPLELSKISEYIPRCLKCYPYLSGISYLEKEIFSFIKDIYKGEIIENDRNVIKPYELDIVIPKKKIAFEFNGTYWHSSNILKKCINYHLNKTLACEEKGYKLIHIWEYDWINPIKQNILKEKIKAILGVDQTKIYARKCIIKEIDSKIKNEFLNLNHIQGEDKSKVKLGLFYNEELVAVMTFGKPRFSKNAEYELIRYATKSGYQVLGGAGKLLRYFERNYNPKSIITYADRSYSQGNMYRKIGFNELKPSAPNYSWVKGDMIYSRYQCQKHKLKGLLGDKFDEKISESQNMLLNGFIKVYDCGNLVFKKEF